MSGLPEGNVGKAAALGIAALLAALVYFTILSPVLAFYVSNQQSLEQRRELVRRYENAVNDLPRLRALAEQRTDQPASGGMLLQGNSDAIAAAELQSNLKILVEHDGVKITSAASLPPADDEGFRRVGVRIAFSGDLSQLTMTLKSIEAAVPALLVSNFDIRVASDAAGDDSPSLSIALEVFGYRAK